MRAKFQVDSVAQTQWGAEIIKMNAVYGGTPEDNTYAQATPSASLELTVTNPALHGKIKPGQKFYLDFTPADQPAPDGDAT